MDKAFSDITIDLHQINAAYVALASMIFDRFIAGLFIAFIAVYNKQLMDNPILVAFNGMVAKFSSHTSFAPE